MSKRHLIKQCTDLLLSSDREVRELGYNLILNTFVCTQDITSVLISILVWGTSVHSFHFEQLKKELKKCRKRS